MSASVSRRRLAEYAANELAKGADSKDIAPQLAAYLIEHKREGEIEQLIADIAVILESKASHAYAKVVSAREISGSTRDVIRQTLKNKLQVKSVELEELVDPSVVGGVRIETAHTTYDSTVRRQLQRLSAKV